MVRILLLLFVGLVGVALPQPVEMLPDVVFKSAVDASIRQADRINANCVGVFRQGYENSKLNWTQKGVKFPYSDPGPLARVEVDWGKFSITFALGPDKCVEDVPPAPWSVTPTSPPSNFTEFIDPGCDSCDFYLAGNSAVPVGTIVPHNGRSFILVVIGKPGSIVYRKLWIPISAPASLGVSSGSLSITPSTAREPIVIWPDLPARLIDGF